MISNGLSIQLEKLLAAGTAVISDIFDNLHLTPMSLDTGLLSLHSPAVPFAGPAYTVRGESQTWTDGSGDRAKLAAIDHMTPGVVPVWAGGDICGVCCFGDLLASAMKARGCSGVVVDGGIRDVAFLRQMGLPMMFRYRTPSQAIGRWRVTGIQETVRVRGAVQPWVDVNPGDAVVADDDGVIIVPQGRIGEFAGLAEAWADKDGRAREEVQKGMPLLDALKKFGAL